MGLTSNSILCHKCGHELTGITLGRCPECGEVITPLQRVALGLGSIPNADERLSFLIEGFRSQDKLVLSISELEWLRTHPGDIDDERARRVLEDSAPGVELFQDCRNAGFSPVESLCSVLDVLLQLKGGELTDSVALLLLPRAEMCRMTYYKLRDLGHSPIAAVRRILPRSKRIDGLPTIDPHGNLTPRSG